MLKKRLVGVVTVKNGLAVQSFGYQKYLPLGSPECLVENLDRWGADEILVQVIDRSVVTAGPDFGLLDRIARLGLGTPLIYGGGIRHLQDGVQVIQSGADRLTIDSLLQDAPDVVERLGVQLGAQALVASIPMSMGKQGVQWYDYRSGSSISFSPAQSKIIQQGVVSEVLLTDWRHEGIAEGFDPGLIEGFPFENVPLILFGGISGVAQMRLFLANPAVTAVSLGNFLSYGEHKIQHYREKLASDLLRQPLYMSQHSLQADV